MLKDVNFVVSDTDEQNFPVNMEDLQKRLEIIKKGIPQQGDNINPFVIPAFTLFKDCGLITKSNLETLNDKNWCDSNIAVGNFAPPIQMNPLGGILRKEGLPMWSISKNNKANLRYYCPQCELKVISDIEVAENALYPGACKCAVICEGVSYYISNDWFSDDKSRPTKKNFFAWLTNVTIFACHERWDKQKEETAEKKSANENLISIPVNEFQSMVESMKSLHQKIDNLTAQIEELKNIWR